MVNQRFGISICPKSTLAPEDCHTLGGERRDTTTMNTSESLSLRGRLFKPINSPNAPCVKGFGPKYVVVYFTCNDSDAIIQSIMKIPSFTRSAGLVWIIHGNGTRLDSCGHEPSYPAAMLMNEPIPCFRICYLPNMSSLLI